MRTRKLTLSADADVIDEAKRLAAAEGTSLSSMVSRLLRAILGARKGPRIGPWTRKAIGLGRPPRGASDRELLAEALQRRWERRR